MNRWLTERDIYSLHKRGITYYPAGVRLTPSAQDLVRRLGMKQGMESEQLVIAIGSDHGGYELKEHLKDYLVKLGHKARDVGCFGKESVDYPDYAAAVSRAVIDSKANFGIMIDTLGIASSIAANKIKGIRAAYCPSIEAAISARGHNDANVLTLGGKMDFTLCEEITAAFLREKFLGGRHQNRIDKITALEE